MNLVDFLWSYLSQLSQWLLKLDGTPLLNLVFLLATFSTLFHYARGFLYFIASRTILTSVRIQDDNVLSEYLMKWITDTQFKNPHGCVEATVPHFPTWEDEQLAAEQTKRNSDEEDDQTVYRALVARRPIQFVPFSGRQVLKYKGHYILFHHLEWKEMQGGDHPRPRFYLTLDCFGRSPQIIRDLLHEAHYTSTPELPPAQPPQWAEVISRPSRALSSVILEKTKKEALLADINEYLHPSTRKWYFEHGIPYRRGYLFSGPPGTGKSSLTSALAGAFGLSIHNLSLLEPSASEDKLSALFTALPTRCILLLEDIDAAGLSRNNDPAKSDPTQPKSNISLSSLLNAIDGVTSPEGRILIMTTNNPEVLDSALIRPGRVDMHIKFDLPTGIEIEELFLSVYGKTGSSAEMNSNTLSGKSSQRSHFDTKSGSVIMHDLEERPLEDLASVFSAAIPERIFSLAAIQGYLLRHKRDPVAAVKGVRSWTQEVSK